MALKLLKRTLYLIYYTVKLDVKKFSRFINHAKVESNKARVFLLIDAIYSVYKYNISLLEFFQFRFYNLIHERRLDWAGTGFMYESILHFNPRRNRKVLADKALFLKHYAPFVKHAFVNTKDFVDEDIKKILANPSGKVVLKNRMGNCGIGIEVLNTKNASIEDIKSRLIETNNDLIEQFIIQHDNLNRLSPAGLNTLRLITQVNVNNEVNILGARLRITINSVIDNLAAGNIAAAVNYETGLVEGPGVFSDITKNDLFRHPVTGVEIVGFVVPFIKESVQLVKDAALFNTKNKSIGWDVAITNSGPELVEANHDWCKLLWQLPVKKGLKKVLESYLLGNNK